LSPNVGAFLFALLLAPIVALICNDANGNNTLVLDQDCVVAILNRTVYAEIDGSFEMPNVPANLGMIKARATCLRAGATLSAETDYFSVASNTGVNVGDFTIAAEALDPVRLMISGGNARTFSKLGASSALAITASYANGVSVPVLEGLNFTSSNPGVVSVNQFGEITARGSGLALITIRKDGIVAMLSTRVATSGDSDGDGIADTIEIDLGLNPNDSIDGLEDRDGDGLANRIEVDSGTDITNPDTDGDGAGDGEELLPGIDGFISNPLVVDTDGDRIGDGLELLAGTDPSDPLSKDISSLVASLEVFPPVVEFTVNTVDGTQGVQLSTTAVLLDGTEIDMTGESSYTSDDLLICNFGGANAKGKVFLGEAGSCTITVAFAGESVAVDITVKRFEPGALSVVNLAYPARSVVVDAKARFAYLADSHGLTTYEITNPLVPQKAGELALGSATVDAVIADTALYLAAGGAGVFVIDISNPRTPTQLARYDTTGSAEDLYYHEGRLYVADAEGGLVILDVTRPSVPLEISRTTVSAPVYGVARHPRGDYVVLALHNAGLEIVDVSEPANPATLSVLPGGDVRDLTLLGNHALLADQLRSFVAVDLADPLNPILGNATARENGGLLREIVAVNELALGADIFFINGVPIINVDDPLAPAPRAILDFSGTADDQGEGIDANDEMTYLVAGSHFYIGRYRRCLDSDKDALCDAREPAWGTDPTLPDSDNDGLADGYEVIHGLDPADSNDAASADTDADGLTDVKEFLAYFTDPLSSDTDFDLLPDGWEVNNSFDPLNPADGAADADGDGFSNGAEFLAGTDLNDPLSTPTVGTENWTLPLDDIYSNGAPAIGQDGTLYISGSAGVLYAVSPRGTVNWIYQASSWISTMPTIGANGSILIAANDGQLSALNPDGSLLWNTPLASKIHAAPAIGSDGTIYIATLDGRVWSLEPDSGAVIWSLTLGNFSNPKPQGSIAVAQNCSLYVSYLFANRLFALNADGSVKWERTLGGRPASGPAIAPDGTILIPTMEFYSEPGSNLLGAVYALNPDGSEKWQFNVLGDISESVAVDADGKVYFGAADGVFYCLNSAGTPLWRYDAGFEIRTAPALGANGTSYFASSDGRVLSLYPDGSLAWEFQGEGAFQSSPVIGADSNVYIGSSLGFFYSLRGNTGGPARGGWPQFSADPAGTGNQCGRFDPLADQDNDGIGDCRERIAGSDPFHTADGAGVDSDGDGLPDLVEAAITTNPLAADSDGDRIPDGWEVDHGLDPLSATDVTQDHDLDGYNNLVEYLADSDPGEFADAPIPGTKLWSYVLDNPSYQSLSAPSLDTSGRLYVGADDNLHVFILGADGRLVRRTLSERVDASPPIAKDGSYYTNVHDNIYNYLYAYNADGSVRWRHNLTEPHGSASIGTDNNVIIGSRGGYLYSIAANGVINWSYETGHDISGSSAIDAAGIIYIGSHDNSMYAIRPDGSLQWSFLTGGEIHSSPALGASGQIAFGSRDGYIYYLNPEGSLLWRYQTGGAVDGSAVISLSGVIYIGSADGKVYALNPNGNLRWFYTTSAGVSSTPALDALGKVIVGSEDGYVYSLDGDSGALVWRYNAGSAVRSGIAIDANGIIYAGSVDGNVHAIVGDSGQARGGWPRYGGDAANTGNQCAYFDPALDTDADGTDDCREWTLGTQP
jgi:outer membrane protein assembly factor BamB